MTPPRQIGPGGTPATSNLPLVAGVDLNCDRAVDQVCTLWRTRCRYPEPILSPQGLTPTTAVRVYLPDWTCCLN